MHLIATPSRPRAATPWRPHLALRRLAAAGVLTFGAAACGGGDDDAAETAPASSTNPITTRVDTRPPKTPAPTTAAPTTATPTTVVVTTSPPTTAPAPPPTTAPAPPPTTPGPTIDELRTVMLTTGNLGPRFTEVPYDDVTPLGSNLCGTAAGTVRLAESRAFSGTNDSGQAINLLQSTASFATVADAVAAFDGWKAGYEQCPTGAADLGQPSTYTVKRVEAVPTGLPVCTDALITGREFTVDGNAFASGFESGALVRCGRNVLLFVNVADAATASADGSVFQLFSTYLVGLIAELPGSADT